MGYRLKRAAAAFALVAAVAVLSAGAAVAGSGGSSTAANDYAKSAAVGGVDPQILANADTIAHWSFTYTDPTNGETYPITMVGSDPRGGGSTTIHTVIIPLSISITAGNQDTSVLDDLTYSGFRADNVSHTFDGTTKVSRVLASPIFQSNKYDRDLGGDTGQYGDVFMRAQFAKIGSGYHVRLVNDSVYPTVSMDVPTMQGLAYHRPAGALAGVVSSSWFSAQLQNLMGSLHISPDVVPIFLTDNVMLYGTNFRDCCTIGYHGAGESTGLSSGSANGNGNQPVQTFIYSAYSAPGTYPTSTALNPSRYIQDIHALSHEVAEWLDDPFVNNVVNPWLTPSAPQYGCTDYLETGDPVVGVWFPLKGNADAGSGGVWHPEDEVNFNWFARGAAAGLGLESWDGRHTFMGPRTTSINSIYASFANFAQGC